MVYIDYVRTVQKTKYLDWDVKTITAGDYSVEYNISEKQYKHWKDYYYDEKNMLNETSQFKQYL